MTAGFANLIWHGTETVDAAKAALVRCTDVELHLPPNFHHALAARFRSDVAPPVESVDVTGGAELLAHFGSIRGLEPVATLAEPAQRVRAEVRVVSPAPIVEIHCRDAVEARAE